MLLSLYWIIPLLQSDIVGSLYDIAQMQFFTPVGTVGSLFVDTLALNNSWMNYRTRALIPVDSVPLLFWLFPLIYSLMTV